ncbi:uncharacterized protein LOC5567801 [Aedes aegypti]|uniref:Uncharacterized protein n=2 Tax=Aedes aegypti TaxID=7159 RepID=A0A1S4EV40_AEDAE|nr:uncharacterized protein LOC5567801 [Aedes aegypti]
MSISNTAIQKEAEVAKNVEDSAAEHQAIAVQPAEKSKADSDKISESLITQDPSLMSDIVRAFSAAGIPLTRMNIPGLLEYMRANLDDPAAPSCGEQLKECYHRFINEELDSPPFCSVTDCSTSFADRRTIFSFPDCKESIKLWKQALRLKYRGRLSRGRLNRGGGVCELHFDEDFLIREADKSRVTLMPGAVPKNSKEQPSIDTPDNNHCRMCGTSIKYYMQHTVTELQTDQHLRPVLDLCLELNDSIHQLLPVTVCDGCANMIQFIGGFAKNCWDAQQKLLQRYAGVAGRKVEPWNRVYQYVENEEVIQAEASKESNPSEVLKITEEQLITESSNGTESARVVEAPIETCSIETQIIEDKETPKPILVKEEPLEKKIPVIIAASNDENDDRELNKQDPPPEKKPRRSKEADSNTSSEQVEKFTCKICLHQFNKQTELVIHNRKHVREQRDVKPDVLLSGWFLDAIKCLQCRKTFPTSEELKAHTSKEHKCDAYCPICGMRFRNNDVLEQHRKRAKRCLKNPDEPSKTR